MVRPALGVSARGGPLACIGLGARTKARPALGYRAREAAHDVEIGFLQKVLVHDVGRVSQCALTRLVRRALHVLCERALSLRLVRRVEAVSISPARTGAGESAKSAPTMGNWIKLRPGMHPSVAFAAFEKFGLLRTFYH